jgi:hypothetical protein
LLADFSETEIASWPVTGISCVSNPTNETTKTLLPAGIEIEKFPVVFVCVATGVPFTATVAPGTGELF